MSRIKRVKKNEAYPTWWPNYRADRSIRIPVILLNSTSPRGTVGVVRTTQLWISLELSSEETETKRSIQYPMCLKRTATINPPRPSSALTGHYHTQKARPLHHPPPFRLRASAPHQTPLAFPIFLFSSTSSSSPSSNFENTPYPLCACLVRDATYAGRVTRQLPSLPPGRCPLTRANDRSAFHSFHVAFAFDLTLPLSLIPFSLLL